MNLESLKQTISELKSKVKKDFSSANDKSSLDDTYRSFLGKKGEVNILLK